MQILLSYEIAVKGHITSIALVGDLSAWLFAQCGALSSALRPRQLLLLHCGALGLRYQLFRFVSFRCDSFHFVSPRFDSSRAASVEVCRWPRSVVRLEKRKTGKSRRATDARYLLPLSAQDRGKSGSSENIG